jgi:hypothetical protein
VQVYSVLEGLWEKGFHFGEVEGFTAAHGSLFGSVCDDQLVGLGLRHLGPFLG